MDRGYANMDVESTQVAITPDKDDIFITLNVKEGEVYRISDVKIAGNLVVPEADAERLLAVRKGDIFSRKMVTATTELMQLRLGQDGYAFAKIDPVPKENPETKEIELTFLVDPGNRAYVRNIAFHGQHRHQRRRAAPRNPPDGRRLPVERGDRALQESACSACRSSRRSRSRPTRCRARPTWSTSPTTSRKACRASSAAASATPSRSRSC